MVPSISLFFLKFKSSVLYLLFFTKHQLKELRKVIVKNENGILIGKTLLMNAIYYFNQKFFFELLKKEQISKVNEISQRNRKTNLE